MDGAIGILILVAMAGIVAGLFYVGSFMRAWSRDKRGIPAESWHPDIKDRENPNVALWKHRAKADAVDIPKGIFGIAIWAAGAIGVLLIVGIFIWGASAIWGALAGAPTWAIAMFVIVLVAIGTRR